MIIVAKFSQKLSISAFCLYEKKCKHFEVDFFLQLVAKILTIHRALTIQLRSKFTTRSNVSSYSLKGHSHAILVHFKNQKYVLTSMNAHK